MKNLFFLLFLFYMLTNDAIAQNLILSRWNIKINPLARINSNSRAWSLSGEYFLDKKMKKSMLFNPYLIYRNERGDTTQIGSFANHRGFGAIVGYRYYPLGFVSSSSSIQKGFYISPFAQAEYLKVDFVNLKSRFSSRDENGNIATGRENGRNIQEIVSFQYGLSVGYQWIWWRKIVFDICTGIAYRHAQYALKKDISEGIYYPITQFGIDKVLDKSYTGLLPKLGFQIGFAF
jgi:hypothetical protein